MNHEHEAECPMAGEHDWRDVSENLDLPPDSVYECSRCFVVDYS